MLCSVQTNDLFMAGNSQTDRLLDDEECKRDGNCRPGKYANHTEELYAKLCESAAVEKTYSVLAGAVYSSYAAVLTVAVREEANCNGAPDTVEEVNCNSADRVVDVKLVVEEPNAEANQESGNQTDDRSAEAVGVSAGSRASARVPIRGIPTGDAAGRRLPVG